MITLGLILLAVAVADLVRWQLPCPPWRHYVGIVAAGVGTAAILVCGAVGAKDVVAGTLVASALTAVWVFATARSVNGDASAVPGLLVTALLLVTGVAVSGYDLTLGGPLERWFDGLAESPLTMVTLDRAVVVVGAALFLTAPANTIVRLLLRAAGSRPSESEQSLKGGRVLGPMERLFIFGLGMAGQLTAASVIVAAKGLLRFPELQSLGGSEGDARGPDESGRRIDALTEYFLLGSMASWLLALLLLAIGAA